MKDCKEIGLGTHISGVYTVRPEGTYDDIEVYCDMATDGGGWTVFQRRVNGSLPFNHNFATYVHGFGNIHAEFWLGLQYIHAMTYNAKSELRIDLIAADGSTAYEVFPNFRLSSAPNYTLHIDMGHGTAGDNYYGLSSHNGRRFQTNDNFDAYPYNCAELFQTGWWFKYCASVNLNGQYVTPGTESTINYQAGVVYYDFKHYLSLKETKMMFRRV